MTNEAGGDRGISHREISWRAAVLRRARPARTPPRRLGPVLLLLVLAYLLGGIGAPALSLEEAVQTSLAADAGVLVTRPSSLLPGGTAGFAPATSEPVRLAYGSFTRYLAGAGWYLSGGRASTVPIRLSTVSEPGPAPVRPPSGRRLTAARAGPAVIAAAGVLVMFGLTRRLLGRAAALTAAVLLGLHPTFALLARQSVDAGVTLTLGLATVLVAAGVGRALGRGGEPRLGAWLGLSLLAGLTLAAGPTAPPYLAGALAFLLAGIVARQTRRHREARSGTVPTGFFAEPAPGRPPSPGPVAGSAAAAAARSDGGGIGVPAGWVAVAALGAIVVWVAVSPALWGWLPERLETRRAERPALVARGLLPAPGPAGAGDRARAGLGAVAVPFLTPDHTTREVLPDSLTPNRPSSNDPGPEGYSRSWWSGLPLNERGPAAAGPVSRVVPAAVTGVLSTFLGLVLTGAAIAGAVVLWRISRQLAAGVSGWLVATVAWMVLFPPGPADRLLPLITVACVLVGAAATYALTFAERLSRDAQEADDARRSPDSLDFLAVRDPGAHRT